MHPKLSARALLLCVVITLCTTATSSAQRLVDGFEFGIGLSMYGGDLDGNPNSDLPSYVGSSRLLVYVGADHAIGDARVGLELTFGQLRGSNSLVDGTHSVLTTDLVFGYQVFGPVALYAGVGPALILPSYDRTTPNAVLDGWAVEGGHFALTFPIGIRLQDTVRIGLRLTNSDLIDGYSGGSSRDIMGQFSIGYRFRTH